MSWKTTGFSSDMRDEDKLLAARIADMAELCRKSCTPRFTAFLDERQAAYAETLLTGVRHRFRGGYEGASRRVLGVFPEYGDMEDFPIAAITFRYRESDKLTHRDFLGAFMSRQIRRDMVGDIIVGEGRTTAFVYDTVRDTLLAEVDKVGSVGVKAAEEDCADVQVVQRFSEKSGTVSSLRLDSVLALALGISRGKAAELIKAGLVTVNCREAGSVSMTLEQWDVFSVRGYGKFILDTVGSMTKKERYRVTVKKYI